MKWTREEHKQMQQKGHLTPARRLNLQLINKNKRTCHQVDFAVPLDYGVKIKESEIIDKYMDLARELKNPEIDGNTNYGLFNDKFCLYIYKISV